MKVSELISALEALPDKDIEVEAFGPDSYGKWSVRTVIGVFQMERKTIARGSEKQIVFINTLVYDR